jgi:hypothetical protein
VEGAIEIIPVAPLQTRALLDRLNGIGTERFELFGSFPAKERRSVAAMRPPLFLLPTVKTGGSICDCRDHIGRNIVPIAIAADPGFIGEIGIELRVRRSIRNTPWTYAVLIIFEGEYRSDVDIAPSLPAAYAWVVGWFDISGRDRVGMIFKAWKKAHRLTP